ncbi:MAG TPA: DUF4258 domain-containing protein [Phycisphaerales bacterium]|nr:DUF4258 domain-containing protein [Phycisphaerales bacterium]
MTESPRLIFRVHAVERMFRWNVSETDIRAVLEHGETIEDRHEELPYPVRLILGRVEGRPLHVVAAFDEPGDTIIVITVYEPDPARWSDGFRRRNSP